MIKSKAPVTTAEYGDRYTLIGPLNSASVFATSGHSVETSADGTIRLPLRSNP